ncbi:YIP1 family protein [Candidatus Woesearchaeota archaeon]|nr:YIP1 family protein [Candidatus Woesearchaeota archaeon]
MRLPFLPTAKDVLVKPESFFKEELRRINQWQQPVTYLLFMVIIGAFFMSNQAKLFLKELTYGIVESLGIENVFVSYTPSTLGIAFLFLLLVVVLLLATSFKYWVAHWYVKLWNKKAKFQNTYAVLTYGGTPGWLAMPFSALFLYLLYKAITTGSSVTWLLSFLSFAVWAGLEGYSIYLRIYALVRIQKITKLQAVLSVYVLGLLTYLVGLVIIEFVVVTIVLLLLMAIGVVPA